MAELEHHGIKGMKWGVRRGSRVTKRVRGGEKTNTKIDPKKLSDEDLKKLVARMRLEQDFKQLTAKPESRNRKLARSLIDDGVRTLFKIAVQESAAAPLRTLLTNKSSVKNTHKIIKTHGHIQTKSLPVFPKGFQ